MRRQHQKYLQNSILAIAVVLASAWVLREFPTEMQTVKYDCDQVKSSKNYPIEVRDHCRNIEIKEMRKIIIENVIRYQ